MKTKSRFRILKFKDGWWSVILWDHTKQWGKWRGPFDTKADAQIDCANITRNQSEENRYEIPI